MIKYKYIYIYNLNSNDKDMMNTNIYRLNTNIFISIRKAWYSKKIDICFCNISAATIALVIIAAFHTQEIGN